MNIKRFLNINGIYLLSFKNEHEQITNNFIKNLSVKYINEILSLSEILELLKNENNSNICINYPIQDIIKSYAFNSVTTFFRELVSLCQLNKLSIIIKSRLYYSVSNLQIISPNSLLYSATFAGIINNEELTIVKSRFINPGKYNIEDFLIKKIRQKKLNKIFINKK